MENTLSTKSHHIWTPRQIWLSAFLTGPFGGLYLLSNNFKVLNEISLSKKFLYMGVLITLAIMVVFELLPDDFLSGFPRFMVPVLSVALAKEYTKLFQKKRIEEHLKEGGEKCSWKKFFVICFLILLAELSIVVMLSYFFNYFRS